MPKVKAMAMVTMREVAPAEGWAPDRVHDISLPASFCSQNPDLTVRHKRPVKAREVILRTDAIQKHKPRSP